MCGWLSLYPSEIEFRIVKLHSTSLTQMSNLYGISTAQCLQKVKRCVNKVQEPNLYKQVIEYNGLCFYCF